MKTGNTMQEESEGSEDQNYKQSEVMGISWS